MQLTNKIQKAIIKSAILHNGQKRKINEIPFITHPYSVAVILSNYTTDENTIVAALLHDVLEDVPGYFESDMERDFSKEITKIVKGVTETNDPASKNLGAMETWQIRKDKYLEGLQHDDYEALMVCAADKIHNLKSNIAGFKEHGAKVFDRFNAPVEKRIKFHKDILEVLKKRLDNEIVNELEQAYNEAEKLFIKD